MLGPLSARISYPLKLICAVAAIALALIRANNNMNIKMLPPLHSRIVSRLSKPGITNVNANGLLLRSVYL